MACFYLCNELQNINHIPTIALSSLVDCMESPYTVLIVLAATSQHKNVGHKHWAFEVTCLAPKIVLSG